ncbi:MAG: hypothetical protein UX91_C0007G0085 [Candidatus Amesbacteria bacterium GW2011_GWB1_47_19]|nr:MAG: hypothetical protein UW51_C0006G0094 [Candidatus Amesbacteria bacterium GW2011_GWA1_44_24]KKU31869.1 MAG: hypothetical protein UX46_C0002G0085 [Candidatus Amesbacteria bacterium GW2011_GWC1_46_24]KKU66805.1 MAG: hypothetical protein UX91_C0007G0085 [Candidatus Amesbacteria bacterium GW2011_GWB1_47_19]
MDPDNSGFGDSRENGDECLQTVAERGESG